MTKVKFKNINKPECLYSPISLRIWNRWKGKELIIGKSSPSKFCNSDVQWEILAPQELIDEISLSGETTVCRHMLDIGD